jgi:hypothetical protein
VAAVGVDPDAMKVLRCDVDPAEHVPSELLPLAPGRLDQVLKLTAKHDRAIREVADRWVVDLEPLDPLESAQANPGPLRELALG